MMYLNKEQYEIELYVFRSLSNKLFCVIIWLTNMIKIVLVIVLSTLLINSQATIAKRDISWTCTPYNMCAHGGDIESIISIFDLFRRSNVAVVRRIHMVAIVTILANE